MANWQILIISDSQAVLRNLLNQELARGGPEITLKSGLKQASAVVGNYIHAKSG